jgi:MFS family permease
MIKVFSRFKGILRALSYRNYRLFFFGQGLSLVGTWMQNIALAWLVYRLTNSVFLLGLVGFFSQIMVFIFSPFAGVIADRFNRHRIVIFTQTLAMLQAFALAALVYTNTIAVWEIMLLSLLLGFVSSFDIPVRQSFVVEMIGHKNDLGNAIALNSSLFNVARLIGPSIAGVIIATLGEGVCFLINGISYLAVIVSLLAMRIEAKPKEKSRPGMLREIREGFAYAFHFAPIRYILLFLGVVSLVGMPYTLLMPVFARDILHGGPETLGFLMGAVGVGALLGAFYLASRKSVIGLGRLIAVAGAIFSLGLILFSFSRTLWLSLLVVMITGFGAMLQMACSNTLLQTFVDEDKRGRVMSLFAMAFIGMTPFGSLLAGSLASKFGVHVTLFFSGFICVIATFLFYLKLPQFKKIIRPIYIKMGILPEVTSAIQAVSSLTTLTEKE